MSYPINTAAHTRYKEIPPLDTVSKVRGILHGLGIATIEKWTDSGVDGCQSLRVEIAGTGLGQNGKGATPAYALASAYAELMERMQNDLLYTGDYDEETWKYGGFFYAPDERLMSIEELSEEDNPWVDKLLELIRQKDDQIKPGSGTLSLIGARLFHPEGEKGGKYEALKKWRFSVPPGCSHDFVAVPFYSLKTAQLCYMPVSVLRAIYGSNGTCAGNNREEALLQGLSELFERNSNIKIIRDKLTPPAIPDWYCRRYKRLYDIKEQIESTGDYRLIFKDCSLGSGFPVVASVLINLNTQSYAVKFGAHPDFEIALERTLTEMFQGRDISSASQNCHISGGFESTGAPDNLHNLLKVASGQYPEEFFAGKSSYEFTPFIDYKEKTNAGLLEYTTGLLAKKGLDIMVRDVSFLGFCSYQVVVPGFSEVFNFGTLRFREKSSLDAVRQILRKLPAASGDELEKLVRYLTYKRNWFLENTLEYNAGLPLKPFFPGGGLAADLLLAACCYRLGMFAEAHRGFSYVAARMRGAGKDEAVFYACLRDYAGAVKRGAGTEEAVGLLKEFYNQDILDQVVRYAGDPQEIIKQLYSSLDCYECRLCPAVSSCSYDLIRKMRIRLKDKYQENRIDQLQAGFDHIRAAWKSAGPGCRRRTGD
ncbi:MAG: hypothetical protein JL50_06300 [Peptococcaceae bacterium BICA1-7]|nr:MAG: hypothetical protein JL50_06300 [Peptococcaceae bacterium BICA1-7]HBV99323.1 hypothetical protein [Desulfotomaculum sp.]